MSPMRIYYGLGFSRLSRLSRLGRIGLSRFVRFSARALNQRVKVAEPLQVSGYEADGAKPLASDQHV